MRDYWYSLIRKQSIASGEQNHWYERDEKMMKSVRKRIREEGSLMAKDFKQRGKKSKEWAGKPANRSYRTCFALKN